MSQARSTRSRPVTRSCTTAESANSQNAVAVSSTSAKSASTRLQPPQGNIKSGVKPNGRPVRPVPQSHRPHPYQLRANTVLSTASTAPARTANRAPTVTNSAAAKSTRAKQNAPQPATAKGLPAVPATVGTKVAVEGLKRTATSSLKPQGARKSIPENDRAHGKRDSVEIVYDSTEVNKAVAKPGMSPAPPSPPQISTSSSACAIHQAGDAKLQTKPVDNTGTNVVGPASLQLLAEKDTTPQNHAPVDPVIKKPKKMGERFEIMLTFEKCSCAWCCENLEIGEGVVLQDCCHSFCRNCLITAINSSEYTEMRCPYQDQCHGLIFDSEIKALLRPEEYQAHIKKSDQLMIAAMRDNPNMYNCKTPNCGGFCEFAEDSKIFLCPLCNKSNCLACKAIHEGVECAEYQRVFQEAVNEGKTVEEAHVYANTHATNGFEQLVGTVSQWMSASQIGGGCQRKSQQYRQVLEKMADQDLWITNKEFDCVICFEKVLVGDGVIFECMHSFCRDCAIANVEHATEPEIKCPYLDGNYSCVYILKPREIRALVSPELYDAHLARSVKLAENAMANTFHCKTPDCAGWCEYEPGTEMFQCWICLKRNCLLCEVIHEGSCEDYKNRIVQNANDVKSNEAVAAMIASGECMRCPKCKVPVQKIAGCDWVPCSVCKTEICWITKGPRWGPGGKGDISGGCRCRVNGKLCHPKCGNCH